MRVPPPRLLLRAVATAYVFSLLSGPALAQLPPSKDAILRYFRDADVVAIGRVTSLRVKGSRELCCRVSFVFHVDRFLKGKDARSFVYSFEPRGAGASEEALRQYYSGKGYVFFYRKPGREGVERNSLWIAWATPELRKLLTRPDGGTKTQ